MSTDTITEYEEITALEFRQRVHSLLTGLDTIPVLERLEWAFNQLRPLFKVPDSVYFINHAGNKFYLFDLLISYTSLSAPSFIGTHPLRFIVLKTGTEYSHGFMSWGSGSGPEPIEWYLSNKPIVWGWKFFIKK